MVMARGPPVKARERDEVAGDAATEVGKTRAAGEESLIYFVAIQSPRQNHCFRNLL